jgi:signal recognition particle subunit SRP54
MGRMKSILKMLPSVGPMAGMAQAAENVDEGQLTRVESIINSMTNKERHDHEIINGNRRKRIAKGSGTTVQDVNNLLRQYAQMRKLFKTMGGGGGIKAQQRMMSQMQGKQRFGR